MPGRVGPHHIANPGVQISDHDSAAEPGAGPERTAASRAGRNSATPRPAAKPAPDPAKTASAEQPLIDRLVPGWQPARGVSQAAVTLAAVLILMLLVGGITSLGRRGVFFLKRREWKQPPPRIRAWKLGPEGMSYEINQDVNLEDERLRALTARVDTLVSNVHVLNTKLPQLSLDAAEGNHDLARPQ